LEELVVLRLGHRPQRDKRITTHLALCARALGASGMVYSGERDPKLEEGVRDVVDRWGGSFWVRYTASWRRELREWGGRVVHLTMYGVPVQEAVGEIRAWGGPLLVVVGGPKVPGEVYHLAHWNASVTNQPHSEVSALALFLYLLQGEEALTHTFPGAKIEIEPTPRGKKVKTGKL